MIIIASTIVITWAECSGVFYDNSFIWT